ncbi:MAG: hypothetical protein ACREQ5_02680, partial [Candidatus Dormibacteria bacterium]
VNVLMRLVRRIASDELMSDDERMGAEICLTDLYVRRAHLQTAYDAAHDECLAFLQGLLDISCEGPLTGGQRSGIQQVIAAVRVRLEHPPELDGSIVAHEAVETLVDPGPSMPASERWLIGLGMALFLAAAAWVAEWLAAR